MQCKQCLGCTAQGEKNFVEQRRCNNFVEDRTNKEKEYEQLNFRGGSYAKSKET